MSSIHTAIPQQAVSIDFGLISKDAKAETFSSKSEIPSSIDETASTIESRSLGSGRDLYSPFVCPYCNECTMEQFFSDEGCPKKLPTKEKRAVLFPYLDMSGLDEADRIDLEDRLQCETRKMKLKFAMFTLNVKRSLEYLEIPLEKIKASILSLGAFTDNIRVTVFDDEDQHEIKLAKTLSDVFISLQKYISFFDYHIIEHIIEQHGATRDFDWLQEYTETFHSFCQRSIFEIPHDVFPTSSRKTAKRFTLKCTKGVATMKGVLQVKGEIARVFGLRPAALQIRSIEEGCVKLYCYISAAVADHIFPVSPSQHSALSEMGVRVLHYDAGGNLKDAK